MLNGWGISKELLFITCVCSLFSSKIYTGTSSELLLGKARSVPENPRPSAKQALWVQWNAEWGLLSSHSRESVIIGWAVSSQSLLSSWVCAPQLSGMHCFSLPGPCFTTRSWLELASHMHILPSSCQFCCVVAPECLIPVRTHCCRSAACSVLRLLAHREQRLSCLPTCVRFSKLASML